MLQESLRKLTEKYEQDKADTLKAIALLVREQNESNHDVKPGQYAAMKPKEALKWYLEDRGGGPIPLTQILRDMKLGGLKSKDPSRFEINFSIMIGNNKHLFHSEELEDKTEIVSLVR